MRRFTIFLSALSGFLCTMLVWINAFAAMRKTLFKQIDMTEEEVAKLEELGNPTWKTYLPVYFLMLFSLLLAVTLIVAAIRNGGSAASVSSVFAILSALFLGFVSLNALGENKMLLDEVTTKMTLFFFVLALLMLFVFTLLSRTEEKRENSTT